MIFGMLVCDDIISYKFEFGKKLTVGSGIIALWISERNKSEGFHWIWMKFGMLISDKLEFGKNWRSAQELLPLTLYDFACERD